jgi:hypothetical protein
MVTSQILEQSKGLFMLARTAAEQRKAISLQEAIPLHHKITSQIQLQLLLAFSVRRSAHQLQAVPPAPNTATAWVLANGAMLSVDNTFTDM